MNWLKRWFRGLLQCRSAAEAAPFVQLERDFRKGQYYDLEGGIGRLPVFTPSHIVRLHVTAGDSILLDDRPIELLDLEQSLRAACRRETLVYYSRDNPEQASTVAADIVQCVIRLGHLVAFSDPRAMGTWAILSCWQSFCEAVLREDASRVQKHCTEQIYDAFEKGHRQALQELCGDSLLSKLSSMTNDDQVAVMRRQLPTQSRTGEGERVNEFEVCFQNSDNGWRVEKVVAAELTIP
jgi:hypothetical protein